MMEAAGPEASSPFDFLDGGVSAGGEPFSMNEFVASPDGHTDDFMASFSLDGDNLNSSTHQSYEEDSFPSASLTGELNGRPLAHVSGSTSSGYPTQQPNPSYAAMSIPQLQQLHQHIVASTSNPSTPQHSHSPATASPAGQTSQQAAGQTPGPSEADLQAILDSMLVQSPNSSQQGGLSDNGLPAGMDLGALMGQLAGVGQGGQVAPPSAPPSSSFLPQTQLNTDNQTATALQRLQQLQQLQHYQSQFIQQQVCSSSFLPSLSEDGRAKKGEATHPGQPGRFPSSPP